MMVEKGRSTQGKSKHSHLPKVLPPTLSLVMTMHQACIFLAPCFSLKPCLPTLHGQFPASCHLLCHLLWSEEHLIRRAIHWTILITVFSPLYHWACQLLLPKRSCKLSWWSQRLTRGTLSGYVDGAIGSGSLHCRGQCCGWHPHCSSSWQMLHLRSGAKNIIWGLLSIFIPSRHWLPLRSPGWDVVWRPLSTIHLNPSCGMSCPTIGKPPSLPYCCRGCWSRPCHISPGLP